MQHLGSFFRFLQKKNLTGIAVVLLIIQGILLAWSAAWHSPVHQEVFNLPAGLSHWELSRFDLCRVNPPLVRLIASFPVSMIEHKTNWVSYSAHPLTRAEYVVGLDTMRVNDYRFVWLVIYGRWACIPLTLLGGWICFLWANRLYGSPCGLVSLFMWCFCPYVLGHGSLLTPDAHAASLGITAAYFFWRWLQRNTWMNTCLSGMLLGLAALSKFTLLIFYPLWIIFWLMFRLSRRENRNLASLLRDSVKIVVMFVTSFFLINIGYEFEDSFRPLGDFKFQTSMLTGLPLAEIPREGGNRFVGTWLENVPFPLPANYLQGIDTQKIDFEKGVDSYLCGQWQRGGWWYFHLFALLIKMPLGIWLLLLIAIYLSTSNTQYVGNWRDELMLIVPILTMVFLLTWQSGIGLHSRYAFPLIPFLFVWISKVGRSFSLKHSMICAIIGVGLTWLLISSLWNYPHSLSYFNGLVGGSKNGFYYLAKSDCSWGQDLLLLREWVDRHPEIENLHLAHSGPFDPRIVGFEFTLPPVGLKEKDAPKILPYEKVGPLPGWYAIEVCFLYGDDMLPASDGKGGWDEPSKIRGYDLSYFLHFEPIAKAGYSIYIYNLTQEDVEWYNDRHVRNQTK